MGELKTFQDLVVWQKSHQLVLDIYQLTKKFPKNEEYGLTNQLRRAVISVPSNIVEGFGRQNKRESCQFYYIARSSLGEVKYQLLVAKDLSYLSEQTYSDLLQLANDVGRLLNAWLKSQK